VRSSRRLYPDTSRLQIPKFRMQGWRWRAAVTSHDRPSHISHPADLVGRSLRVQCLQFRVLVYVRYLQYLLATTKLM
jgi:hypothetical protein